MKKFFMVLSVLFLCIIVVWILAANYVNKLDKSSKVYADKTIPIIVSSWDKNALIYHVTPGLLKSVPKDKWDSLFNFYSEKLGFLKEYKGSEGRSNTEIGFSGKTVTATYVAKAIFEKSDAEITIGIIQHDEKWQIFDFSVRSEVFVPLISEKMRNEVGETVKSAMPQ